MPLALTARRFGLLTLPIAALALSSGLRASQPALIGEGPSPSITPISWELEFKFLDPRRIEVQGAPGRAPEVYWYMVYTVTNPSERTQYFFPTFQIVTDDLRVIDTDMGVSPLVYDAIRERHQRTHPYLVAPTKAIGDLLTGDDNARESVAIWRDVDLKDGPALAGTVEENGAVRNAHRFRIYVAGLSGETRFVRNPRYDPTRPETVTVRDPDTSGPREIVVNPPHFTLRKTLELRYNLPGSAAARPLVQPERVSTGWVMR